MWLGIDVSKNSLDAALITEATDKQTAKPLHKVFPNNDRGHQQLLRWLQNRKLAQVHACLEATGSYAEPIARALQQAGHQVSLVNPAQIAAFAKSQLSRTKTDKTDAQRIARFCQMYKPALWQDSPPEIRALQALVRRLESLEEMSRMEENRLQSLPPGASSVAVRASLEEHIAYLQDQIKKTRRQIKDHIDQNPTLKEQKELLTSIPGIGETTAALFLAEVRNLEFESARQLSAFVGLVPRHRQSGTSVRGHSSLSKTGSSRLRKGFYFPALAALRHNPLIQALGERLSAKGKCGKLIVAAAMRKLLVIAYGVLKSGKPFENPLANQAA
jgi:transposase